MFQPVVFPEIDYKLLQFSGGEYHIQLLGKIYYATVEKVVITHRMNTPADIVLLHIAVNALRLVGVKRFDLVMPYVPYARQDRHTDENFGQSFTLDVFADLINPLGFEKIYSLDVHSNVTPALVKNLNNVSNLPYVVRAINYSRQIRTVNEVFTTIQKSEEPIWLISPDSGANSKINKLHKELLNFNIGIKGVLKCDKKRDVLTGKLSGFEVPNVDMQGFDYMIVDDICDGGGTFIGLAKELAKHNPGNGYLFVSHGIFSAGYDTLNEIFQKIYTTNSVKDIEHPLIKQFKFEI